MNNGQLMFENGKLQSRVVELTAEVEGLNENYETALRRGRSTYNQKTRNYKKLKQAEAQITTLKAALEEIRTGLVNIEGCLDCESITRTRAGVICLIEKIEALKETGGKMKQPDNFKLMSMTAGNRAATERGDKTNTRRVIVPQPIGCRNSWSQDIEPNDRFIEGGILKVARESRGRNMAAAGILTEQTVKPRYSVGDIVGIREPWWAVEVTDIGVQYGVFDDEFVEGVPKPKELRLLKNQNFKWGRHSSLHMEKELTRKFIEIIGVRVEQLQDISIADIRAEGLEITNYHGRLEVHACYYSRWETLWDSINKKRGYGWDKNPWVWVYTFKKWSR